MVRHARFEDYNSVMRMMVNFANSAPIEQLHNPEYNHRRIQHLLAKIQQAGCVLVAENKSGELCGMLIAMISEDLWLPHIKTLKEVAWWVEPEHRNSTMGYRLLRQYVDFANSLAENKEITNFTLTNMTISPAFDLAKRGWREIETNYVYEGK